MNSSSHFISWCNLSALTSCGKEIRSLTTPREEPFVSIPPTTCFTWCPLLQLLWTGIPSMPSPGLAFHRFLLRHFMSVVTPQAGAALFLWSPLLPLSEPPSSPLYTFKVEGINTTRYWRCGHTIAYTVKQWDSFLLFSILFKIIPNILFDFFFKLTSERCIDFLMSCPWKILSKLPHLQWPVAMNFYAYTYIYIWLFIYFLLLTFNLTGILHSSDMKILNEKGWLKCPSTWCSVMLALLKCFEITKRFQTWTSKFPFWSQMHKHILQIYFPYHHFTWLEVFHFTHRSPRTVVIQLKNTFCHRPAKDQLFHTDLCPSKRRWYNLPVPTNLHSHFWSILELWAYYLLHRHSRKRWHCLREEQQTGTDRVPGERCGNTIS